MKLKWVRGYKNEVAVVEVDGIVVGFIGLARELIIMDLLGYSLSWGPLMDQYVVLLGCNQRKVIGMAPTMTEAMLIMNKQIKENRL